MIDSFQPLFYYILGLLLNIVPKYAPCLSMLDYNSAKNHHLMVQTTNGRLRGILDRTTPVRLFFGIRYAKAPVRDLRWAPPEAYKWQRTYRATKYRNSCPQFLSLNEDCLYLNIAAPLPREGTGLSPIMVFIHGGAFLFGSGDSHNWHSIEKIVANSPVPVIAVTFNYRIGALGFLAGGEFEGNYGIMDQRLALQFIFDNATAFGGDPSRITIVGESAGALSVAVLRQSKLKIVDPLSFE